MTTAAQPSEDAFEITEGDRVLIRRNKLGLTKERLGQLVGVTDQTIYSIEHGGPVRKNLRPLLARELGVTTEYLLTGEAPNNSHGGKPVDIRRKQKPSYGWSQRRTPKPYIVPPLCFPEHLVRRAA